MENSEVIDIADLEINRARDIYENLSSIFSDADPAYLQQLSVDYALNVNTLNILIENLIAHRNYPKKKIEEQTPVTHNYGEHRNSVDAFVDKFNDPISYFRERKVGLPFAEPSKIYLKSKFQKMSIKTINSALVQNQYNLSLTFLHLENIPSDRQTKRSKNEIKDYVHIKNEDFQDEVYFLENQEKIKEHLAFLKLKLETAKANNELLECQCCFNDEVFDNNVMTCMEGHIFCKPCVKRSIEIAFGDGKIRFDCLSDCKSEFPIDSLQGLISETLYKKIMAKFQESEIKSADISGICFCPYCEYAEIPPEGDKIFKCKSCLKESCCLCHSESHIPFSCKEYEEQKNKDSIRKTIEDKMTEALLRECYKCKKKYIKQDGCNKMTCICGALMCYLCRQPVKDYSHFDNSTPHNTTVIVNASTSTEVKKCPLYSNNNVVHDQAVIEAAKIAVEEAQRSNPTVNFDQTQLLKGLKRKSVHPHYRHNFNHRHLH